MSSSTSGSARAYGSGRTAILRGASATLAAPVRLDVDLRGNPFTEGGRFDARLLDPTLAQAVEDAAAEARALAHEEGYAAGHAAGFDAAHREAAAAISATQQAADAAERERRQAVDQAIGALRQAAADFGQRQLTHLAELEDLLLEAAYDLATVLLGRELESVSAPVRDAARRALTMLPGDGAVTLYVHPVDVEALGGAGEIGDGRHVRVVPDPDVEPGSCLADAGATHVDASLRAALERVREVLTP